MFKEWRKFHVVWTQTDVTHFEAAKIGIFLHFFLFFFWSIGVQRISSCVHVQKLKRNRCWKKREENVHVSLRSLHTFQKLLVWNIIHTQTHWSFSVWWSIHSNRYFLFDANTASVWSKKLTGLFGILDICDFLRLKTFAQWNFLWNRLSCLFVLQFFIFFLNVCSSFIPLMTIRITISSLQMDIYMSNDLSFWK